MRSISTSLTFDDRALVRRMPMFAGLKQDAFEGLVGPALSIMVPAKNLVFMEGDPALDVHIVVYGWVKLYRITPDGEEAVINVFGSGQSFAEAVAFAQQVYPATAETVTDARLIRLPASHIIAAIRSDPDIALAMLGSTSVHLHRLVSEITRLKGLNGVARLVEFLATLDGGQGARELTLPFEKQLLARHLGIQPESLSRAFRKLRDYGIEVEGSRVVLTSRDALRRAAEEA
jgi:CRP-like cAMP-binding protein